MIKIREVGVRDLGALKYIDLKASIYPATSEMWTYAVVEGNCINFGVQFGTLLVGFIITEQEKTELRILRLKISPAFRSYGLEEELVAKAESLARDLHANKLSKVIPELHCIPGDPDDESYLWTGMGFKATKIIPDAFVMYGDLVDGFKFERGI